MACRSYHVDDGWYAIFPRYDGPVRDLATNFQYEAAHQGTNRCPARIGGLRDQDFAHPQRSGLAWIKHNTSFAAYVPSTGSDPLQYMDVLLLLYNRLSVWPDHIRGNDCEPVLVSEAAVCRESVEVLTHCRRRTSLNNGLYLRNGQEKDIDGPLEPASLSPTLPQMGVQLVHREEKLRDIVPAVFANNHGLLRLFEQDPEYSTAQRIQFRFDLGDSLYTSLSLPLSGLDGVDHLACLQIICYQFDHLLRSLFPARFEEFHFVWAA